MRFILLLVAAVVAVVAGVTALKWSGGQNPAPQTTTQTTQQRPANVSTVEILVARDQIPIGTVIKEPMLEKQPWPAHLVLTGFVVVGDSDSDVVGRVARTTFMPHEPILKSRLGNPNDPSFLAASLPEGMRAVTLATDTISGVAGYVFPGDRVDILATHNIPQEAKNQRRQGKNQKQQQGTGKPAFSEVLVANARVLAVNLREPPGKEGAGPIAPNNITLEVPDTIVQQIRLAEKLGTLSLSLRSLKDIDKYDEPSPTTFEDLTQATLTQGATSVRIVRGANDPESEGSSGVYTRSPENQDEQMPASTGMNPDMGGEAVNQ